jgi:hypothetical protein
MSIPSHGSPVRRRFNILPDAISRNNLGLLFRELPRAANARRPMRPELWMLLIREQPD